MTVRGDTHTHTLSVVGLFIGVVGTKRSQGRDSKRLSLQKQANDEASSLNRNGEAQIRLRQRQKTRIKY